MVQNLKKHLLEAYGGYADKRVKDPNSDNLIKIDDRDAWDKCPDFCSMFIRFVDPYTFQLLLTNLPLAVDVEQYLATLGANHESLSRGNRIEITLSAKSAPQLRKLATLVRRVVGRGRRYANPNWKWICPRTADSLKKLAWFLAAYVDQSGHPANTEKSDRHGSTVHGAMTHFVIPN